jgi:AcrR family transcriptional regulator
VGKASLYRRWPDRAELLVDALVRELGSVADVDSGAVLPDLVQLARQMLELYLGAAGPAALRLSLEVTQVVALKERHDALRDSQLLAARAVVRRAVVRGELPESTSATLLLDTLCGGAVFHALSTPLEARGEARKCSAAYAQRLADFVLKAATAGAAPTASG